MTSLYQLFSNVVGYYCTWRERTAFAGPGELGTRISCDFTLKEGVASLCKTGVTENLLKDWRRAVHHHRTTTAYSVIKSKYKQIIINCNQLGIII